MNNLTRLKENALILNDQGVGSAFRQGALFFGELFQFRTNHTVGFDQVLNILFGRVKERLPDPAQDEPRGKRVRAGNSGRRFLFRAFR